MKKLLLSLTIFSALSLNAGSGASKNYADFKKWGEGVKTDWLRWEGKFYQDKYNMFADQASEWFKYSIEKISAINALTAIKDRDSLFEDQLNKAVVLYEKLELENSRFWENKYNESTSKAQTFRKQLKDFKIKVGLEKPEAVTKDADAKSSDSDSINETEKKAEEGLTKSAIADKAGEEVAEADEDEVL